MSKASSKGWFRVRAISCSKIIVCWVITFLTNFNLISSGVCANTHPGYSNSTKFWPIRRITLLSSFKNRILHTEGLLILFWDGETSGNLEPSQNIGGIAGGVDWAAQPGYQGWVHGVFLHLFTFTKHHPLWIWMNHELGKATTMLGMLISMLVTHLIVASFP